MPVRTPRPTVRQTDDSRPDRAKPRADPDAAPADGGCRSLRRGLDLLEAVLRHPRDGLRVAALCREASLERATVHRLLGTLVDGGYVEPAGRYHYRPGPRAQGLLRPPPATDLAARLQPVLARVSEALGDAAFAITRDGTQSHCVARQVGTHPVQVLVVQVGRRQPLGVGAAGLALLSALPDDEAGAVIRENAAALRHYGGMTPTRLELLVRSTRERGWSVVGNHVVPGAIGVGLPVLAADGTPVAAISVAAGADRMPARRQRLVARRIRDALQALLPHGL